MQPASGSQRVLRLTGHGGAGRAVRRADRDLGGQGDVSKVGYNRGLLGDNASFAAQIHDDGDTAFLAGLDDPRRFGEFGHCAAAGSVGVGDVALLVRSILEMKLEADI